MTVLLAVGAGLGVGVVLGLLGAGGSLLAVPALVVLLGLSPTEATGTALLVVAAMALTGLVVHRRAGRCACRSGLLFASSGVATAALTGWVAGDVPESAVAVAFAVLLVGTAAWFAARGRQRPSAVDQAPDGEGHHHGRVRPAAALLAGGMVGALTGVLGVGGGFLAVPALAATLGLAAPVAVGTSHLVILTNAVAGLVGRSLGGDTLVWSVGAYFAAAGMVGAAAGSMLTGRFSERALRLAFAAVASVAAAVMVARVLA